ncbi:uncharacterized protein BDV17DRAFT_288071 [Aspergillus undulatus]|uniref:uncharacterized protein n=1 Tax=Aspergillus undulatus TaxID=1810928 RepID=UPI003CCD0D03
MVELLQLPVEILHRVCSHAELESRKALRLANKLLGEVARRWVFECATVSPLDDSCIRLDNILESPNLASCVKKLYINTFDLDEDGDYMYYEDAEDEDFEGDEETNLPTRFTGLFDHLDQLPRLQDVVLRFHREYTNNEHAEVPQELEFRSPVIQRAFAAFASLSQPLKHLSIRDLHNINETAEEVVAYIQKVLGGLESLRLNITNKHREYHGEMDYKRDEALEFYAALPSFWLRPTTSTLQHLTLYSSLICGFYPKLDFNGVHFPYLKTLSLGNYAFVHDSQLDWILSHGATLTELYLDDCTILYEVSIEDYKNTYLPAEQFEKREGLLDNLYASYSGRWADCFRAFRDKLPHLQHFRYGHSPDGWEFNTTPFERETGLEIGLHEESYLVFCDGFGPSPYMSELIYRVPKEDGMDYKHAETLLPSEEDKKALQELCARCGQDVPLTLLEERL